MILLSVIILTPTMAMPQSGGTFAIQKSVIARGGGSTTGGSFALDGTMGEAEAGSTSTGGTFSLGSGFWGGGMLTAHRSTLFDYDADGRIRHLCFSSYNRCWYLQQSQAGLFGMLFGFSTDKITPG